MKNLLTIILSLSAISLWAQDCPGTKGTFINLQTRQKGNVCFHKIPDNTATVYTSTYTISDTKSKDLYNIELAFNIETKTIDISIKDMSTGFSEITSLPFQDNYSLKIVANYTFNDTLIDTNKMYRLFFTIPNIQEPFAALNEFTTFDSSLFFKIEPIRPVYIAKHLADAKKYYASIKPVEVVKAERKPDICLACVDSMKIAMDIYTDRLLTKVADSMDREESEVVAAGHDLQAVFNKRIEDLLRNYLDQLKCSNTTINGWITVNVDSSGAIISPNNVLYAWNGIETSHQFTRMWREDIQNQIGSQKFANETKDISRKNLFANFNSVYRNTCQQIDPGMKSFEDFFRLKNLRFSAYTKVANVPTKYMYQLQFKSKTVSNKWILKKKTLLTDITDRSNKVAITRQDLRNTFFSQLKRIKNGRYRVTLCSNSKYNGEEEISIDSVKRRYIFYTHIGLTAGLLVPLSPGSYNSRFGDYILLNGFFTYHHFGIFGGTAVYRKSTDNMKPTYIEGGIYLAPCNYLYFKMGYTHLMTETRSANSFTMKTTHHPGFLGGISLIFPVFHMEAGYNLSFNAVYVNAGFNIPLNK